MKANQDNLNILFNENKLKVLFAIYNCGDDVCACNIAEGLSLSKNLLSYHVKTLLQAGLISEVRCGRFKSYKIDKDKINKIRQIFKISGML
jgi:ArsR family transcriptional regulator